MIKKIINKVRAFDIALHTGIPNHLKQQKSLDILLKMFEPGFFFPITPWTMNSVEIQHICNEIMANKRRNIVEFGSGFSTICIAQMLKSNKIEANFISVDNNPDWILFLKEILKNQNLEEYVNFVTAPLADVPSQYGWKEQKTWFNTEVLDNELKQINNVDMIIVDGPEGDSTSFARYSAVPYLKNKLNNSFSVFLDDAHRKHEIEITNQWQTMLNCKSMDFENYIYFYENAKFGTFPF
ncbi:MAG: class I SAM-dependent methyltransferase [Weeksellaceae bacterium]